MAGTKAGFKKASPRTPAAANLTKRLTSARKQQCLALWGVAEKLQVDISFVRRTEKGERVPDLVELNRLCTVLKLDIEVLLKQVMSDLNVHTTE